MTNEDRPAEPEALAFSEEWPIQSIVTRARQRVGEPTIDPDEAKLLRQLVKGLLLNCQVMEEIRDPLQRDTVLDAISEAYRLGMFSGSKEIVDELRKRGSSKGGKESAVTRNAAADEGWRRYATALAREFREREPSTNQRDLANNIRDLWREKHIPPPGSETLVRHIQRLEKEGKLRKRRV